MNAGSDRRAVARAIDALRRGWAVTITGEDGPLTVLPVETASAPDIPPRTDMLVSGQRAATLNLSNQRDGTPDAPVRIVHAPWLDARTVGDPAHDLAAPLKGPFNTSPIQASAAAAAAIRLARLAGLLPAFHILDAAAYEHADADAQRVQASDVMTFDAAPVLTIASRARLPIAGVADAQIVAFRSDGHDPVALIIGAPSGSLPLVRLHSECLTGDALGSLKCDCGPQLDRALREIAADGWGLLLYLRQEGRGIGLVNKIRAYALQDQGFDTVDANLRLGFEDDARDFAVAAAMLRALGQPRIRLLTNNPRKVAALQANGIDVVERLPLSIVPGDHNRAYLATKRSRSGHLL